MVARENAEGQARQIAAAVAITIENQREIAAAFATEQLVKDVGEKVKKLGVDGSAADVAILRNKMKENFEVLSEHYLGIFVTDVNGILYTGELAGGEEYKGSDVSQRGYFQEARRTGKAAVGEIVKSKSTGKLIYVVCAPVTSQSGEFLGIFGVSIKAESLTQLVSSTKVGETGYAFMIDKNGIINSHPKEEHILSLDLKKLVGMEAITGDMMSGKSGVQEYVFQGVSKIAGFAPVPLTGWSVALTQNQDDFLKTPRSIRNSLLAVTAIAVLLVGILVLLASRTITRPLKDAVVRLKDIAEGEGDLTMRLNAESKDEVGEMALWFNTFIEKLQGIIKHVTENSKSVNNAAAELTDIADQLSAGAEDTSQRAATVTAAAEEMSTNLSSVAAAMEQSSTNANMVASAAEEMSSTINEIAENAERARNVSGDAVTQAGNASSKMSDLGQAAEKIGKVTETITEISEQTNLLALNATIEAARAGAAGKGFAVVANEIKDLANQTAGATLDIKNLVEDVQNTTKSAGAEIVQISKVISGVNDIVATIAAAVEEQTAATREIADNISQTSMGIQEVNENVSQSSIVASEISQNIAEVDGAATNISTSSNEVKNSSDELQSRAVELNSIVGSFKV